MASKRAPVRLPTILGCVPDMRARNRVSVGLRDHAVLRWYPTFPELQQAMKEFADCTTILIGLADQAGSSALPFVVSVRNEATGTAIVGCCELSHARQEPIAQLAAAGVHDVL